MIVIEQWSELSRRQEDDERKKKKKQEEEECYDAIATR
jgi:hypothetical protein